MYPEDVNLNEQSIARLIDAYKKTYKAIVEEIQSATDFGVANRRAILSQIEKNLTALGVNMSEFISKEIPAAYMQGIGDADKQFANIGSSVRVGASFNQLHTQAIAALMDDTSRAIGEGLSGINRSAQTLLGKATRDYFTQTIFKGVTAGETVNQIRKTIKGFLTEKGLDALIDKAGHTWDFERYAEMLFRTKIVEARNRGLINRVVETGNDLVQVSAHLTSCDLCAPWQGKVLSATGKTPGYQTVADAEAAGLFHPNCRHAINTLIPSLANKTRAYNAATGQYEAGYAGIAAPNFAGTKPITPAPAPPKPKPVTTGTGDTTISAGKYTLRVTQSEADFMKSRGIKVVISGRSRSSMGSFSPSTHQITLTPKMIDRNGGNVGATFFHELGHAFDYLSTYFRRTIENAERDIYTKRTHENSVIKLVEADGAAVIRARLSRSELFKDATEDQINIILKGGSVKLKINGVDKPVSLPASYLRYVRKYEEIYADAYGQYRTDPAAFEKRAPELYKHFKEAVWQK